MTNNEFVVLTTVTSLTVFVIYCGSPYEFISDYWINDRILVHPQCKKKYPIDFNRSFKPELTQSFIEFQEFQRSSVIKLFVLQIDRGEQNASLYITDV